MRQAATQLHQVGKITTPVRQAAQSGPQAVFVRLAGAGAADVAAAAGGSASRAVDRRAQVNRTAESVLDAVRRGDRTAKQLFTVSNAIPGMGMMVDAAGLRVLEANSNVVKVSRIVSKTPSNANVAGLVRAMNTWNFSGNTGQGVKVGVIDTGIDYTHADFGGLGTPEAYTAAHETSAAPGWRAALPDLAKAKIKGGRDFAGDAYDADDPESIAAPDTNPLDCNDHGTHVAGTSVGYGVKGNGDTFTGNYAKLDRTKLMSMAVGPGMAPEASLYSLKVFGCDGSTNVVIPALDWALDPNGDGNFADHLDIVNMSLGSDYGPEDDPENEVVNELAAHGVLSVISMGNNGDLTDTGGTPGDAVSSLTVASSVDALQQRDGLIVNAPATVDGITAGQFSVAYDWLNNGPTGEPVTGDVVAIPGDNADGCSAFSSEEAAAVEGKVVWLEWDDNDATRACGSVGRSGNAATAGAIGSLFTSDLNVFGAGITGSETIPVFQMPKAGTDALRPAMDAGTLNVTFDGALQATIKDLNPSISDTLSGFSSRGPHGSIGVVKPDVAAPGDTVSSAGMGTGNQVLTISGTSMAAPATTGVSALVKAAHPGWSPEQVKAAVMNTAGHDVWTGPNKTGHKYGPARVGAGRIDAKSAVTTEVLAYAKGANQPVSASFGVVPAPIDGGKVTKTKRVLVTNLGKTTTTVKLAYQGVNNTPGVVYSVSPETLTLAKKSTKQVTVTMKVSPGALRHTIDPTMASLQLETPRQFVADSSGRLLVTPKGKDALRVPVYGAAKPVSTTTATAGEGQIDLTGTGLNQGGDTSSSYHSILSVLEAGASSEKLPACSAEILEGCTNGPTDRSGDLQYVGAGSSMGAMWFGISTYGDWPNIGNVNIPYVDYDVDGDSVPDFETYLQNLEGTDLLYAWTVDLNDENNLVDLEPVNFLDANVDTNVFDTNVVMMPVFLEAIGLPTDGTSAPITYSVGVFSGVTGADIDHSSDVQFDAGNPNISTESPLYDDQDGSFIPVTNNAPLGVDALVLHLHGAKGHRAEVVNIP